MSEFIVVSDADGVRTIRMTRHDKKNALTGAMYSALAEAINSAAKSDDIRCLLVAGGPGAFSAGNDIQEFMQAATGGKSLIGPALPFLHALAHNQKPIVAAVQGLAIGVGTTMLLHCDQVIAASDARFSTPFISLGLLPEAGSSLLAPRLMGHARAFSLLVMGQPLTADQAREAGLVTLVTEPANVEAAALKIAQQISALPPDGVAIARRLMRGSSDETVARIDEEAKLFAERIHSPEARAAFAAFLNRKR